MRFRLLWQCQEHWTDEWSTFTSTACYSCKIIINLREVLFSYSKIEKKRGSWFFLLTTMVRSKFYLCCVLFYEIILFFFSICLSAFFECVPFNNNKKKFTFSDNIVFCQWMFRILHSTRFKFVVRHPLFKRIRSERKHPSSEKVGKIYEIHVICTISNSIRRWYTLSLPTFTFNWG